MNTPQQSSAFFAGSFNPFTIGHRDIVERGIRLFGHVTIAIGHNERKPEDSANVQKRLEAIRNLFKGRTDVDVISYSGLTAQIAKERGETCLMRGIRDMKDYEYERNLADVNRRLFDIETILLFSDPQLSYVSSSMVRELENFGFNASEFVATEE